MDAFYASVEVREHPEYKGKPVIIGADPKGGKGRGVVAACSYEARKFGVRSAMPITQAYRLCPNGVYLPPDFELYEKISSQIMEYLKTFTELIEPMSIDEAFMDVTETVLNYTGPEALAKHVQGGIFENFKLTCSIGIAHNRSIAKIASDHNKPVGITYVPHSDFKKFLGPLSVGKISGIGPKTQEALHKIGIFTISDLGKAKKQVLMENLGNYGLYLWDIANGLEGEAVSSGEWDARSISREFTFHEDTNDFKLIERHLEDITNDLIKTLRADKNYYKTVTLKIRFEDFETFTRSKSLNVHTQSLKKVVKLYRELLKEFQKSYKKVRLIGLKLSNLKKLDEKQITLEKWE
jgi:DNA polymerase IV (DinB-like DNA polymerase)